MRNPSREMIACCSLGLIALGVLVVRTEAAPVVESKENALAYLERFGYKNKGVAGLAQISDEKTLLENQLREFQRRADLNVTGLLDEETLAMMNTPRCAVSDDVGYSATAKRRRRRRYAIEGSRWSTNALTYGFSSYTSKLPQATVKDVVKTALGLWSKASRLTFTERSGSNNNIQILYAAKSHGDRNPFDGPLGVLAHAYFPSSGGAAHFDEDESWTHQTSSGTNLLQVSIHEFGHSLGLGHSNVRGSIMYAFYSGYTPNVQLKQDDIDGIQALYGAPLNPQVPAANPTTKTSTTTRRANPATTPTITRAPVRPTSAICSDASIDDIVVVEGKTYAFKGTDYYVLNDYGIEAGYPRSIASMWPAVGGYIDAALYYDPVTKVDARGVVTVVEEGHLFIFKGDKYWKYDRVNTLLSGYPRLIRDGFPGLPNDISAAFIWSGNGQIYFFKGSQYYRYTKTRGVDAGYPQSYTVWPGIPNNVGAAFQWTNKRTYFFSGKQYYRFNDILFRVDDGGFPRPTNQWWLGCKGQINGSPDVSSESENAGNQFSNVHMGDDGSVKEEGSPTSEASQRHHSLHLCYAITAALFTVLVLH